MDIKNFRLQNRKNIKKISASIEKNCNEILNDIALNLEEGVDIICLSNKDFTSKSFLELAFRTRELCSLYEALLFIEEKIDIAFLCCADGIVLSKNSIDINQAKKILDENFMFGFYTEEKKEQKEKFLSEYDFLIFSKKENTFDFEIPHFFY